MSNEGSRYTSIAVPYAEAAERSLHIRVGACHLRVTRGSTEWVTGTYDDPTGVIPCRIVQDGGLARITQETHLTAMPALGRGAPTFDLKLGTAQPYALIIETGASESDVELGGLPLTRLTAKLGAGRGVLQFLEPNPQTMDLLDIDAGAGSFELRGLANANFAAMTLDGGAATFVCDFGGSLRRDAAVHLSGGLSTLEVQIPSTTAARIVPEVTLGVMQASGGYTTRERGYWTPAALEGASPVLTIRASLAMGSLHLRLAEG